MVHLTNLTNLLLLGEDSPAQHERSVEEFGQEEGTGMHGYDTVGNESADIADGPWKGCFSRIDIPGRSAKCKAGDRRKGKGSCVAETYSIPDHDDELCRSDGQNGSRQMTETCVACVVGERLDCDRRPSALPTAGCGCRTSYSSCVLDFVVLDEWTCQEV